MRKHFSTLKDLLTGGDSAPSLELLRSRLWQSLAHSPRHPRPVKTKPAKSSRRGTVNGRTKWRPVGDTCPRTSHSVVHTAPSPRTTPARYTSARRALPES